MTLLNLYTWAVIRPSTWSREPIQMKEDLCTVDMFHVIERLTQLSNS